MKQFTVKLFLTVDSIHMVVGVGAGVGTGAAEAPITISKTITDIA